MAFVDGAKRAGVGVSESCRRLGISSKQLGNWRAAIRTAKTRALVRVRVTNADAPHEQVAFVAPSGFRVEGLSVEQAIELMRALA